MSGYDAIIIGSGLGGLVTSLLLVKDNKKVLVLERSANPGGCCSSYVQNGFVFDVPSIMSLDRSGELGEFLEDIRFTEELEFVAAENFSKCYFPDVEMVFPSQNLDGCIENLTELFPEERVGIQKLFRLMDEIEAPYGKRSDIMKTIKFISFIRRTAGVSFYDFVKKYVRDDKIVSVLGHCWSYFGLPPKQLPAFAVYMMGRLLKSPVLIPKKGFHKIPEYLGEKIVEHGGEIRYNTHVETVLIKDNKAMGVRTRDGQEFFSNVVVSDADTVKTHRELVGEKYSAKWNRQMEKCNPSYPCASIHLGTRLNLCDHDLRYGQVFYSEMWDMDAYYERSIVAKDISDEDQFIFGFHSPTVFSSELAPDQMHSIHGILYPINYRNQEFDSDDFKEKIAHIVGKKLDGIMPGFSSSIVEQDVLTPRSFERYVNSTHGAMHDSVYSYNERPPFNRSKTPIKDLFMTGTKAFLGPGLTSAMRGGIWAYHAIKRR